MKINEYQLIEGAAEEHVFRNCKILGSTSRNGYKYSEKAVQNSASMYDNVPVFVDHNEGSRSYGDMIGVIQNPTVDNGELYGDFVMNPCHSLSEQTLWFAKNKTQGVGFSHSIEGTMNKDKTIVESIDKVFSVDLVASPATVKSFHESLQLEQTLIEEQNKQITELSSVVNELKTTIAELVKSVNTPQIKPIAIAPVLEETPTSGSDWIAKLRKGKYGS